MAIITPTLALGALPSSGGATAGPLSIELNLQVADSITVGTLVESGVAGVTATHTDNLIYSVPSPGAYIYLNNHSDTTIFAGSSGVRAGRFLEILAGEFAWMPWAAEQPIYLYHLAGAVVKDCEFWVFFK
tara:strand:- start:184 stop:573 length:390 start_codon:yes stop_codon:yes gene_type:complete